MWSSLIYAIIAAILLGIAFGLTPMIAGILLFFVALEIIRKKLPKYGRVVTTLVVLIAICSIAIPVLRGFFGQFLISRDFYQRRQVWSDLWLAKKLNPPKPLAAEIAVTKYQREKEDYLGQKLKIELDAIRALREAGQPEEELKKLETKVIEQYKKIGETRKKFASEQANSFREEKLTIHKGSNFLRHRINIAKGEKIKVEGRGNFLWGPTDDKRKVKYPFNIEIVSPENSEWLTLRCASGVYEAADKDYKFTIKIGGD